VRGHLGARRGARFFDAIAAVLREPNHRRAFLLVALLMLGGFSVVPYLAPYSVHNVGVRESELWMLWFFGGGATLFTSRWIGRQVDLRGKQRMFRAVALASLVPALIATHLPPVPLWVAVLSSVLFMTTMSGRFVPAMALVNSAASPGLRGTFLSLSGAVQQASAGLASLLAGLVIGHRDGGELTGYGAVGWFAALVTLGAVWVSRRLKSLS
jgi:predicted MFS family arabinose efflux permease